jgi:peptide/nickel transport system permease protein
MTVRRALRLLPLLGAGISVILAVIGPLVAPYNPRKPTVQILQAPSPKHVFGTDASGLDIFSVTVAGFRTDVFIAVTAVLVSLAIGIALGILSGYSFNHSRAAGIGGAVIERVLDLFQSMPVAVLGLALVAALGRGITSVIIAVTFVSIPIFARLLRGSLKGLDHGDMVAASRSVGLSESRTLWRHALPNALDSTLANASIAIGSAILLTASLSFLGAGVRPPTPEWGAEISVGANYVATGQWWISVFPGLVLGLTVVCFAILGDTARLWLNPARARSGSDQDTDEAMETAHLPVPMIEENA